MKAPVSQLNDPDMQAAPQALLRAAEKARRLAEQTGTPFVIRRHTSDTAPERDSEQRDSSEPVNHTEAQP